MNINEVNYVFQYPADMDPTQAADQMSNQFCQQRATDIGINLELVTEEYVLETCTRPLSAGLLIEMADV